MKKTATTVLAGLLLTAGLGAGPAAAASVAERPAPGTETASPDFLGSLYCEFLLLC